MSKVQLFIVALLVWIPVISNGQAPYFHETELEFLGDNERVNCLIQCKDQFLFIGTSRGAFRYDGVEFERYSLPIQDANITSVCEDEKQMKWIGTVDGAILFQEKNAPSFTAYDSIVNDAPVTAIINGPDQTLWISTYGNGIFIIQGSSVQHLYTLEHIPDPFIYTLIYDNAEKVYAGTDVGVLVFNTINDALAIEKFTAKDGLPDNIVRSLAKDDKGNIWVGTHSMGIAKFDPKSKSFSIPSMARNWMYGTTTSLFPMGDNLWIGTNRNGIINLGHGMEESILRYDAEAGLTNNRILCMYGDLEGNVWIMGHGNKLIRTNKKFNFIDTHEEVSFKGILAITADRKGNIWFSNREGLFKHNIIFNGNNVMQRPLYKSELNKHTIISLVEDKQGYIWAGTFDHGVIRIDPESGRTRLFNRTNGLADDNVIAIAVSGEDIWLATLGGVIRMEPDGDSYAIHAFGKKDGLGNNYVFDIKADSKGRIWFATDGSGLTVFENGRFRNYSSEMDSLSQVVYSIAEDKNGSIWFSTPGNGIYIYNGQVFRPLQDGNNEKRKRSLGVIRNNDGDIVSVSESNIDIVDVKSHYITTYGEEYGIRSIEPQLKAMTIDILGNVWIGGIENTIILHGSTRANNGRPITRLLGVDVLLQPIDLNEKVDLTHKENHLTFRFAGLWFQNPEAVHYRYKLEGYDRDWIYTGDRNVTFSYLHPGSYTFRVQSSHTNSFEKATEEHIDFIISPPFYGTTWFILIMVLLLGSAVMLIIRTRVNRLKKSEADEREKLSFQLETLRNQVNPHFLFNSFNTLMHLIEEDKDSSVKYVENLSQFFRDILQYRDQNLIPLWEEIALSKNYIYLQKQRYNDNLQVAFSVPENGHNWLVPPLTLQLLIENALKHNMATRLKPLQINVSLKDGYLFIANNLQLKTTADPSTRLGLENIRKRFSLLTELPVDIEQTDEQFCVAIPLIEGKK